MPKYLVLLESGRDLILDSPYHHEDPEDAEESRILARKRGRKYAK